jgi:hypothetical protein
MELKGSLPSSQVPSTGPYVSHALYLYPHILFILRSILILSHLHLVFFFQVFQTQLCMNFSVGYDNDNN